MSKNTKQEQDEDFVVVYARLSKRDLDELRRRGGQTGATIAAQIRILVHEALHRKGKVVR